MSDTGQRDDASSSIDPGSEDVERSEAKLLGVFQVSILHNAVHVLFGFIGRRAEIAPGEPVSR